jgi:uncharacterized protein (DUF2384 family)
MPDLQRHVAPADIARRQRVLTQATVRAAEHLALPNAAVANMLGVSVPTVSRMKTGEYLLADGSKPFELAQLFLRMFRSLDAIVGSDDTSSQSWMRTENVALNGRPIDLAQTVVGLVNIASYLDSRRAVQ